MTSPVVRSSVCRCASVSLRPLTCDNMKGHRWGPWEQRCIRVSTKAHQSSKLRKFTKKKESFQTFRVWLQSFLVQVSGIEWWVQQHVSPEGGSSSRLPLCAEQLHGATKKAAKCLWPRHMIHTGVQTMTELSSLQVGVYCYFYTNLTDRNWFSSVRCNVVFFSLYQFVKGTLLFVMFDKLVMFF